MAARKTNVGYLVIALAAVLLAGVVYGYSRHQARAARANYVQQSQFTAQREIRRADAALRTIYENLRTLASLPSLRTIDRHGKNLSEEARVTFQQIYENLAASVAVSEVYIVPADLDPARLDPATGKAEAPILMFDHLIFNAGASLSANRRAADPVAVTAAVTSGPPEVESYEYRQLTEHMAWLRQHYPEARPGGSPHPSLISGEEVITCDNTEFIKTGNDADRSGVLFSVPFYGADGHLRGTVTAIMLTSALRRLLPPHDYVLLNLGNNYAATPPVPDAVERAAAATIAAGKLDPRLIYSAVLPLATVDARSLWSVWVGRDNREFAASPELRAVRTLEISGYAVVAVIAFSAMLGWYLLGRDVTKAKAANAVLERARDEARQAATDASRAEAEARDMAAAFKELNDNVTRLNLELAAKVRELHEAQDNMVRKGKLAQLGQLTATVAHELRNPMGVVRTSAFALRRKLAAAGIDMGKEGARIEAGIERCDGIISQLLDFARAKTPDKTPLDVDRWLASVVAEEALLLPQTNTIDCDLGLAGLVAAIDGGRLHRAITNLLSNASEAMSGKDGTGGNGGATPHIQIRTRRSNRGIEISVSDNGPGISREILERVREPLFTTKNFGTGLGLPAVEQILELHGGGLDIASEPGQGATFTAWLPVEAAEAA